MRDWRNACRRPAILLCAAGIVSGAPVLRAQEGASPAGPTVGLALSGGSAKGFAHIGVIRVLERAGIPVDVITGTSMGSVIGGLYAIGYGADALTRIAADQDWGLLLSDGGDQAPLITDQLVGSRPVLVSVPFEGGRLRLPSGLVAGQRIFELLSRLTWPVRDIRDFRRFAIPFGAVATDIATGEPVLLDRGNLADAIRASMALPTAFTPVGLDGRLLIDGGIARNLPAEEARRLGADMVICSDVSDTLLSADSLRSFVDILLQTITLQMQASTVQERGKCDVLVVPEIGGLGSTSFDEAEEWARRGEVAAEAVLPDLERVRRRSGRRAQDRPTLDYPPRARSVRADRLVVSSAAEPPSGVIRSTFGRLRHRPVTADSLEAAAERAYATGLFDLVTYRVDSTASGSVIVVDARPRARNRVGFGARYDGHYKASLLFTASFGNPAGRSLTHGSLRVGEESRLMLRRVGGGLPGAPLLTGLELELAKAPLDIYAGRRRIAEVNVQVASLAGFLGLRAGSRGAVLARLRGEWAKGATAVSPTDTTAERTFATLGAAFLWSTLDRRAFPRRGVALDLRTLWADRSLGSGATFSQHVADASAAVSMTSRLSLRTRAVLGMAVGDDLPAHYRFYAGGQSPSAVFADRQWAFIGIEAQELSGVEVQLFDLRLQYRVGTLYASALAQVGNVFERGRSDLGDYRSSFGAALGTLTPLGPVEVMLASEGLSRDPRLSLTAGYEF